MTRRTFLKTAGAAAVAATAGAAAPQTRPSRPNFLVILADDMGFSDLSCYGAEIQTPHLDRLAANGLRFTQFYSTARCWPTRSCVLTGHYAQQIRMDPPQGPLPAWARVLPAHLKPAGYRCYHSGKWHVHGAPRPVADGGFDRSYKIDDHNRHFYPQQHTEDDRPLPPVKPGSDCYSTTFIADHAIRCLKEHQRAHAGQPFLEYLAFICPHFPLHAPAEDIARYRQMYLEGWDAIRERRHKRLREMGIVHCALSPLDTQLSPRGLKREYLDALGRGEADRALPWKELSAEQKQFQAAKMAVHAAMIDRMDREIGRVLDQIKAMGELENTVVLFASDNGASAEILVRGDGHDPAAPAGSAKSFLCLGPGWSTAGNTPFRRHKIWVHEGGIATPLVVHWPRGIAARGELRHDPGHVIDIVPTLLDLAGAASALPADAPPLPGRSLAPAFARDGAVQRDSIYFHHEGNRALRMGDWKVVSAREDGDAWQLYDLATDRCEQVNLAGKHPDRAKAMGQRWSELDEQFCTQAGPARVPARKGRGS